MKLYRTLLRADVMACSIFHLAHVMGRREVEEAATQESLGTAHPCAQCWRVSGGEGNEDSPTNEAAVAPFHLCPE